MTHKITIKVEATYVHGDAQTYSVSIDGDGNLDHFLTAFQSALVASGFHAHTAEKLAINDD